MDNHPETPEEAIAVVRSKSRGRTRYQGQPPFIDEILVQEIDRLSGANKSLLSQLERSRSEEDELCRGLNDLLDEHGVDVETTYADAFRRLIDSKTGK